MMKGRIISWIQILTNVIYVLSIQKDIVFMVDTSFSVNQGDFKEAKNFVYDVSKYLHIGQYRVSVVLYNDTAVSEFDFNAYPNSTTLLQAIKHISHIRGRGSTNTTYALSYSESLFTVQKGSRQTAEKVIVVLTDGDFNDPIGAESAAKRLHANNVTIYGVGLGNIGPDIYRLTGGRSDEVFSVSSYKYICNLVPKLVPKLDPTATSRTPDNCPNNHTVNAKTQKSSDKHIGAIAGTSSAVCFLLFLLLLVLLLRKKLRNRKTAPEDQDNDDLIVGVPPQKTFMK